MSDRRSTDGRGVPLRSYDRTLMGERESAPDTELEQLSLRQFRPVSQLRLPSTTRDRSAVPAIDAHAHLGRWLTDGAWAVPDVARFVSTMDEANITTVVNLDGLWGDELQANLERYDHAYPGRFLTCCHADWDALIRPDAERKLADDLRRSVERGAIGLKIWKSLGLAVRDGRDALVGPDDARLEGLWETAADLDIPVFMHTADPPAFFEPVDARNERLEELLDHPEWSYNGEEYPSFDELATAFLRVVDRHPNTRFVGVHVGGFAEDLAWVSSALGKHPNLTVDIAARVAELGRQPRATRALIERHPTRVVFGTDGVPPTAELYSTYFRFLESADESFPYSASDPPPNGRWAISGLDLPTSLLELVYRRNVERAVLRTGTRAEDGP